MGTTIYLFLKQHGRSTTTTRLHELIQAEVTSHTAKGFCPVDDGARPTFLSSFVRKLSQKLSAEALSVPVEAEPEEEPEPTPLVRESLVELHASLPDKLDISREAFEQFLLNLSLCREPIAFELLGTHRKVVAQFVAGAEDAPLMRRQILLPNGSHQTQNRLSDFT